RLPRHLDAAAPDGPAGGRRPAARPPGPARRGRRGPGQGERGRRGRPVGRVRPVLPGAPTGRRGGWERVGRHRRRARRTRGGSGPGDSDDLHDDLVAALGMTPVQQAQWWDGLTDEERALFLAQRPGLAAQLADGVLTDDERAQVTETLLDLAAGSTTVSEVVN